LTTAAPAPVKTVPKPKSGNPDTFNWINPYGGLWSTAANWQDITAGAQAVAPPDSTSNVSITGGTGGNFADITGIGAAAQLTVANQVLLWGTAAIGGGVTLTPGADLDLDGAILSCGSLILNSGALLGVGNASTVIASGGATLSAGTVLVTNASTVQIGALIANPFNTGYPPLANLLAVDDNSVLEIGTVGGAAAGAVTFDTGTSSAVVGTIDGNIVLNGNLGVQAYGQLTIDAADPYGTAQSITGTGTLTLSQNSLLTLGVADSAAIRFGGPNGTLELSALPTGTISGFAAGDIIRLTAGASAHATGLSYAQPTLNAATLILTRGGRQVGTIALAGNYTGSQFHLSLDAFGTGTITLRTIGTPPIQPRLILGTAGFDTLAATASGQTVTGSGGNDILNAGTFTGVTFKDTAANLNGATITAFGTSDVIDLSDLRSQAASVTYAPGSGTPASLIVTDGTQTATIALSLAAGLSAGYLTTGTDGGSGTILRFTAANIDAYSFNASPGGVFGTAAKWLDTTTGTTATVAPSYGNAITIASAGPYTSITGSGFAASLLTRGNVLLNSGNIALGTQLSGVSGALTQTGTLALDAGARFTLTGAASVGGVLEVAGGSTLTAAGALSFARNGATLLVTAGSSAQFAAILGASGSPADIQFNPSTISVDANASIEIGTSGSLTAGALTVDAGITANLAGTIQGNVAVNGTIAVAGSLAIAPFASSTQSTTGAGTIQLSWGDTLTLGGSDTATILFDHTPTGALANRTETLALLTSLTVGTITGFTVGDVITIARTVTSLSYTQSGATGRLTLLNGTATVMTLTLSGTYAAGQFLLLPAADGSSSTILCTPVPSTTVGTQISGDSHAYIWTATGGGAWSNAGNWLDATTGSVSAAPGGGNAVTISDNTGAWTPQTITGSGSAAALTVSPGADTIFTGTMAVAGRFYVNNAGATLGIAALNNGASFSVGSLNVTSALAVTGRSTLLVSGSSTGTSVSGALTVIGASTVKAFGGTSIVSGTVAVDATSSLEFGATGGTAAGTLTIDAGQTVTLQGAALIAARMVLNGSLTVYSGTIQGFGGTVGSISGSGTITIGALGPSGSLILNAADTAAIAFRPYTINNVPSAFETLELAGPLPTGAISGFLAGDTIIVDRTVTGASYRQNGTQGILTLTNGSTTVGTLTFAGTYSASLFQVDVAAATGVATITLQTAPSGTASGTAASGTDAFSWNGTSGGSWATATNWKDTTATAAPVHTPTNLNPVTVAGTTNPNQYTSIGGNGFGASLTTNGNVLLTGQVSIAGAAAVRAGLGPPATLALATGAKLTVGGSLQVSGRLQVSGTGSAVTASGSATITSGSMLALNGSTIQAAGLIGTGIGNVIAVDTASAIKIGASATAALGTFTQAANTTVALTGTIYGNVVANGTISVAAGGSLFIDMSGPNPVNPYASTSTIGGTGTLSISEGSTLGLGAVDSAAIAFAGPNAVLALAALPTATITGFVAGDQIQVDQRVTGMVYRQTTPTAATLTLTNGANTVGTLKLGGTYGNGINTFHLDVAPNGNAAVITLQSLAIAPIQPTLIQGTVADDILTATADGQTMTGFGGNDNINAASFATISFKDLTANLNGDVIQNFAASDTLDFTDLRATGATYGSGVLSVTDGIRSANINLGFGSTPTTGAFHITGDGATGSLLTWS
jgi:hypothetical protein